MNNDLISREALKKALKSNCTPEMCHDYGTNWCEVCCHYNDFEDLIDNAPTVELDESIIQEILNKRCMTVVTNEYLIALHGKRSPGKWIKKVDDAGFVSYICSECGAEIEVEDCSDDKFCFNCGAKMQKGGSNG